MRSGIRPEDIECPLSTALAYVGEWWTLLLLHDLFDGYTRFDQFQGNLQISSSTLTNRLNLLMQNDVVERHPYQTNPIRYEYNLTEFGRTLRPILVALAAWGNAQIDHAQRSMILVDASSGEEVEPILVDRKTGRQVDGPEFIFTAGPGASPTMRKRYKRNGSNQER